MSTIHSELLVSFIKDFRIGLNVAKVSKKGARSVIRLNKLRQKVTFILRLLQKRRICDVRRINRRQIHELFHDMRTGKIRTRSGTPYKSTGDYIKDFKTFWHWYQKVMRSKGKVVEDVTEDLDARGEKPKFVYFSKEDFESIIKNASYDLKPILALAFDSGMRVTELMNIRISDFSSDYREVNIRQEISKTFGRKIKLMLSPKQIREYVSKTGLHKDDFLSKTSAPMINRELKRIAKIVLSAEQTKYKNLSLYDFRHSSACFWLPKYKSESALKYRFGWKKSDMIHYYTEFLGMKDTITQDDLYDDITKAELEKEVENLKNKYNQLLDLMKKLDALAAQKIR